MARTLALRFSNSDLSLATAPSSVVHTGVKSLGWEKKTPHPFPSHSWKWMVPSVDSAVKSGASSPSCRAMLSSFVDRPGQGIGGGWVWRPGRSGTAGPGRRLAGAVGGRPAGAAGGRPGQALAPEAFEYAQAQLLGHQLALAGHGGEADPDGGPV